MLLRESAHKVLLKVFLVHTWVINTYHIWCLLVSVHSGVMRYNCVACLLPTSIAVIAIVHNVSSGFVQCSCCQSNIVSLQWAREIVTRQRFKQSPTVDSAAIVTLCIGELYQQNFWTKEQQRPLHCVWLDKDRSRDSYERDLPGHPT